MRTRIVLFAICLVLCFSFLEAKDKAVKDKFTVTVYNQDNEPLENCYIVIKTSIKVYTDYTNSEGIARFKIEKEKGEAPAFTVEKKGYKVESGFMVSERLNVKGDLLCFLEKE